MNEARISQNDLELLANDTSSSGLLSPGRGYVMTMILWKWINSYCCYTQRMTSVFKKNINAALVLFISIIIFGRKLVQITLNGHLLSVQFNFRIC